MQITLGEALSQILNVLGSTVMIAIGVALGIYIMRRTFQCSINQTYIIEDNCFCDETCCKEECEGCPMQQECKEKCFKKEEKKD